MPWSWTGRALRSHGQAKAEAPHEVEDGLRCPESWDSAPTSSLKSDLGPGASSVGASVSLTMPNHGHEAS